MDHWKEAFKGEYIQGVEIGDRQPTMTIANYSSVGFDSESKGVITFQETDRGWVINKTNGQCLQAMFGSNPAAWRGKRVTLYFDPTITNKGEVTGGIRIVGSPDLDKTVTCTVRLPKKRPKPVTLKKTEGKK